MRMQVSSSSSSGINKRITPHPYLPPRTARSPSPYADRYRSRSPYTARTVDRDPYERSREERTRDTRDYDRYGPNTGADRYAPEARGDRDQYHHSADDRYRPNSDRYAPDHDPYGHPDRRATNNTAALPDNTGPIPDPLDSPALLQFKQFAQVHRQRQARLDPTASTSSLSTQEMFSLYKRYKLVYTARSARKFWEDKRNVPFFVEKYGMAEDQVARRVQRRRRGRVGKKAVWLQELRTGKLDGINFQMHFAPLGSSSHNKRHAANAKADDDDASLHTIFSRSGDPIKIASDSLPIDPCPNQLLIMRIPPTLARRDIEAELQECPGFQYLAVGEAHANKHYFAIAWAVFDDPQNTNDAKSRMLDSPVVADHSLQLDVASRGAQVKFRTAPSGSGKMKRLARDYKQARDLVRFLEKEDRELLWPDDADHETDADREAVHTAASAEISRRVVEALDLRPHFKAGEDEDEVLLQIADVARDFSSEDEEEDVRRSIEKGLDFHLDLLREVYNCDYYSSTICDFREELQRRARAHFRRCYPNGETEAEREGRDTGEEGQNMGEEQWAENLDRKNALLLGASNVDIEEQGGVDLDKLCLELAIPFTRQDDTEKHRCIVEVPNPSVGVAGATKPCDKLFRALNFVQKHVCNKHKDLIDQELGSRREDIAYLNNYIRDPTRVMPPLTGSLPGGGGKANGHNSHHSVANATSFAGSDVSFGGVMRLGASTFVPADGYEGGGGGGRRGRRRSGSPGARNGSGGGRLSDRLGALSQTNPPPIHLGAALGLGGGAGGMAGPPLHLRIGGQNPFGLPSPPIAAATTGGGGGGRGRGSSRGAGGADAMSPMSALSAMAPNEPLPPAPRPLDPRAARGQQRSYQDLDTGGGDGQGDVMDLQY